MNRGGSWSRASAFLAFALLLPTPLRAQFVLTPELLQRVFPGASRAGPREGQPPVYRAFKTDSITGVESPAGFVFLTSDIPPETTGYTAPIQVLAGMDLTGTITGIRVISYRESLRSNRGDFLGRPGVQGQFAGKSIMEEFRVRRDIEPVTGATISTVALATGVRNAARRVAAAYMTRERTTGLAPRMGTISLEDLERLTWPEVVALGLATEISGSTGGSELLRITVTYLRDEAHGTAVMGDTRFLPAFERVKAEGAGRHMIFIGMNGPNVVSFPPEAISFVQGGDTVRVVRADFVSTGLLPNGKAGGEFRRTGILLVSTDLDVRQPFTAVVDMGRGQTMSGEFAAYPPPAAAPVVVATAEPAASTASAGSAGSATSNTPAPGPAGAAMAGVVTGAGTPLASAPGAAPGALSGAPGTAPEAAPQEAVEPEPLPAFDFSEADLAELIATDEVEQTSTFALTLERTSWGRVGGLLLLLSLVTWAFVSKRPALRWVALAGTLAFLGFVDRGFLSVSHILAGMSAGPEVYLEDLSLLILASFTVVTTLFWGRVFCGFLCPFGALQDLLEKIVPARVRREFSRPVHERALFAKYGILGIVLAPAILAAPFTLYHWFEPFGTVFYWSPSILLWAIAIGLLVASAIVPRFYCRYACPLGAALAIGSLLSPFRIRRVEQCTVCTVCEHKCPTGAIAKERIDFKECVRCNVCETALIEKAGVCKHDMDTVRTRLVQLTPAKSRG